VHAFRAADLSLLAPVGRKEIAVDEKLDVARIAERMRELGQDARAPESHEAIVALLLDEVRPGDTIVVMSNGDFQGMVDRLCAALVVRTRVPAELSAP
jgi:UDP-N-acetylmuramate: L-alanyl-gamma-D-glutamyl-meso-diaminopimelate ligase